MYLHIFTGRQTRPLPLTGNNCGVDSLYRQNALLLQAHEFVGCAHQVFVGGFGVDIAECFANTDKAEKVLGWKAEKNLDDMCRDAWKWQKSGLMK